jgi:acyl transferase domain-containing protein
MASATASAAVAACLAGVFSLADGLRLIAARGRLMQATSRCRMLAVAASASEVAPWLGDTLDLAAINGPAQCVVSGPLESIDTLHQKLEARQIISRILPGERAFHSRLMEPILAAFEAELLRTKLSAPKIRILSNLTGGWMTDDQATSARYWVEHLRGAVRFADNIRCLADAGGRLFVEMGPGRALAGLVRDLHPAQDHVVVTSLLRQAHRSEHEIFLEGLLWVRSRFRVSACRSALVPLPTTPARCERRSARRPAARRQLSRMRRCARCAGARLRRFAGAVSPGHAPCAAAYAPPGEVE